MASRLCGRIINIVLGKMHAHVHILWKEIPLSVIITRASCDDMYLNVGDAVTVIVRGTDVMLAKTFSGVLSARNKAKGVVRHIVEGDVLSKVCVESQGDILHAYITNSSLKELCLHEGDEVTAFVKSTELIVSKDM